MTSELRSLRHGTLPLPHCLDKLEDAGDAPPFGELYEWRRLVADGHALQRLCCPTGREFETCPFCEGSGQATGFRGLLKAMESRNARSVIRRDEQAFSYGAICWWLEEFGPSVQWRDRLLEPLVGLRELARLERWPNHAVVGAFGPKEVSYYWQSSLVPESWLRSIDQTHLTRGIPRIPNESCRQHSTYMTLYTRGFRSSSEPQDSISTSIRPGRQTPASPVERNARDQRRDATEKGGRYKGARGLLSSPKTPPRVLRCHVSWPACRPTSLGPSEMRTVRGAAD